ncbi:probable indole-3-pyruvate monooxygenase YUCCA10 [Tanacetum coccineum]
MSYVVRTNSTAIPSGITSIRIDSTSGPSVAETCMANIVNLGPVSPSKNGVDEPVPEGVETAKFASIEGMNEVLENGPWFIRSAHIILKKWTPNANLLKKDLKSFYVSTVMQSWGCMDYARTSLIDIRADRELKKDMVIAILNVKDDGEVLHTVRVEYE